jgi:hypothetical protein
MTAAPATPALGPQAYVTHCARADSVTNTVGFGVRAASSDDPAVLRAIDYPAYELPLDLWDAQPKRTDAPRRLARVLVDGQVLVVHSAYLEADTLGRGRSYFTHALLLPEADPADVLRSWGAEAWATDYPPGAGKQLPPATGLAKGTAVRSKALTAFLADESSNAPLATTVCPDRLTDPARRRDLLERFVFGVYLAAWGQRGRLFVHAEPGLVALLLYAAVRALPGVLVQNLTFTTYEPAHRGLKDFTAAVVVGTYLGNPEKGLGPDLAEAGYILDTFDFERSSPDLRGPVPAMIRTLVQLAERNQWRSPELLDALLARERPTEAALWQAAAVVETYSRVRERRATSADLTGLFADDRVPAVVKGAALAAARAGPDPPAGVALELLLLAPADVLAAYARGAIGTGDPVAMIDAVFHPEAEHTAPVLRRMLERPDSLAPEQWNELAARYRLFDDPARMPVLLADQRLARFLRAIAERAAPHWTKMAGLLDARGLLTGDPLQAAIRDQLIRAWAALEADGRDPKRIVPEAVAKKVIAASVLRIALSGETARYTRGQLLAAFRVLQVSELSALETLYQTWIGGDHPGHRPEVFRRFTGLFDVCFPPTDGDYREPARRWLSLSAGCAEAAQEWFQLDYLMRAVPAGARAALVREPGLPFLPEVVAGIA